MSISKKILLYILVVYSTDFELVSGRRDPPSVIIIGAGAAGIAAASKLIKDGIKDVTILEAEKRIGGRIRTTKFNKYLVDLGAQYVYRESAGCSNDLTWPDELMGRDFTLQQNFKIYDSSGLEVYDGNEGEMREILQDQNIIIPNDANSEESIGQYIESVIWKKLKKFKNYKDKTEIMEMILMMTSARYGADSKEVSVMNNDEPGLQLGNIKNWMFQGYSTILDVLMKRYPNPAAELPVLNNTILDKEVSLIEYNPKGGKVIIKTTDGDTYCADHVIVTIPLGVLKEKYNTLFHPSLPERKINTILGLGYGNQEKVFIYFKKPFWNDTEFYYPSGFGLYWKEKDRAKLVDDPERSWLLGLNEFLFVDGKPKLLMTRISGKYSQEMNKLSDQQLTTHIIKVLQKFLGKDYKIVEPIYIIRSRWNINKNFMGSWTYYKTKEHTDEVVFIEDLAEPIGEPMPKILFAGEATHSQMFGSVQGALYSGYREGRRICQLYGYSI